MADSYRIFGAGMSSCQGPLPFSLQPHPTSMAHAEWRQPDRCRGGRGGRWGNKAAQDPVLDEAGCPGGLRA